MSLSAPIAVPVEIRAEARADGPRAFRLSARIAEAGVTLERPAPFDIGRPITAALMLPDLAGPVALTLRAVVTLTDADGEGATGGSHLEFLDPPREARAAIARYVAGRLGLPGAPPSR